MADTIDDQLTVNRERQRQLYGAPLGDRVRRLTTGLGISQARLARTLGLSPAMLSQLVSARRVKIGDPAVLARLMMLDQRCRAVREPPPSRAVDALLTDVAGARWHWAGARVPAPRHPGPAHPGVARPGPGRPEARSRPGCSAADALRGVADPARLAAAAVALGPGFPELAEVLRQAACHPGS